LEKTRRFFLAFSKSATPQRILAADENSATVQRKFVLSWMMRLATVVELTLPKDANVYAQQYALCLPDKALFQQKLREWIAEFKDKEDVK
jgi:hypothetical protein